LDQNKRRPELEQLLRGAEIFAINGGNPDVAAMAFRATETTAGKVSGLLDKLQKGRTIFLGRSAGAMLGGDSLGLTDEFGAWVGAAMELAADSDETHIDIGTGKAEEDTHLGHHARSGMDLIGDCAIRPHWSPNSWTRKSNFYAAVTGLHIVRVPNGQGMVCSGRGADHKCIMHGRRIVSGAPDPGDEWVHKQGERVCCGDNPCLSWADGPGDEIDLDKFCRCELVSTGESSTLMMPAFFWKAAASELAKVTSGKRHEPNRKLVATLQKHDIPSGAALIYAVHALCGESQDAESTVAAQTSETTVEEDVYQD